MSSILYYITGHGYGHAVRSNQVIRSLKKARPDADIQVRTTAPKWLFPKTVRYSRRAIDVGIEIAARASVPSVAIANFTWDGIYSAYLKEHPEFEPLIDEMKQWYAKATLALTLPYPCDMNVFPLRDPIPEDVGLLRGD